MELNKLIFGDCFDYFKNIPNESIDLILTDPPYGINLKDGISRNPLKEIKNDSKDDIDWKIFFSESYRILKQNKMLYLCCRMDFIFRLSKYIQESEFIYSHDFIWLKGDMGYGNLKIMGTTHEFIIALCKGNPEKSMSIKIDNEIKKRTPAIYWGKVTTKEYYQHPTQKPIGMMAYIILNRTKEKDLIFDPFAGVSSTLIAAKMTKRSYLGIELDEDFYNLSNKRIHDENYLKMFENLENRFIRYNGAVKLESLN